MNRIRLASFVLFIFILIFLVFSPYQYGDPVDGERIVLRQPDGTEIVGIVFGDEFHHRIETEDGYTIILDEQTGKIEYARLKQRKLVPSGMVVGTISPAYLKKIHFPKHLSDRVYRVAKHRLKYPEKFHDVNSWERKRSTQTNVQALTGTLKVFVICVEFQYEEAPPTKYYQGVYPPGNFNTRLFSTNPADISMANYYKANSYDQFHPVGYTYPNWVTLPQTASWYEDSSSWRQMIRDAMDKIKNEDPSFDFSLYANNGILDVIVIWAGSSQTWGDFYWPHMSSGGFSRHGVTLRYYNAVNETHGNGTENTEIGTFCHEYGHMTGSPDLYDYSSFNKVVGYYGIMAWSNPGTNFCGYLKWKEYGWITPTLITSGGQYYTDALGLATVSNPRLYQIMIDNPKEYLLIENRYNGANPNYENYSFRWSGLLITHVDENYPPAVGQPSRLFYGLEAIVPGLDPTITELSLYTIHFRKMVFSADQGYTRLDPYYPDLRPPGSYLVLSHDDGIEHVIFRNTQGHTKSTNIWIINISNAGSTMSFSVNVQMYWISGSVYIPSVQGEMASTSVSKRRRSFTHRPGGKLSTNRMNTFRSRAKSKRTKLAKLARKVDQGISGVEMNGLPGNPITGFSGDFTALVEEGWTGVVTPSKEHYSFNPPSNTYTNVSSDLDNQDFEALRNIYAPKSFYAKMELNCSLSQAEYINVLVWYYNSYNENIVSYRIYLVEEQNKTLLRQLDGNTIKYWHRNVNKDTHYKYAVCAVNNEGKEGEYAYAEIN